ncbi:hypothetical protein DO71_5682 [Burkholderia pseudomallei]|nr:hypothetical protein DO71_5682 [Burkholderia pseudomallei]KOS94103.1 hypothetical protein DM45_3394 [Burkholderia mallei]KOT02624.1 hypothetical protein DM50_3336 [Burkholderia mallei]KOT10952.1 hypothetical protein DM77_2865 [Burkholderia mallei]KOT23208.1 hypothetical protein DM52_2573 [Burkholderia mallei]
MKKPWIAFCPLRSSSMPSLRSRMRNVPALPTYAGEPGIVEKMLSTSFVGSPVGPRYGSSSA